jgi:REP element-mobilizing transposase RayT
MPRIPKTHIDGGLYFTTSRADGNLKIFNDSEDYETYRKLLLKYQQQYQFGLFAYVLLPGYLHLLIELHEGLSVSNILHDINSTYTKYYNAKYQRKGHVFQERYRLTLAEKSAWLLPVCDIIHTAPDREGVCGDLSAYAYSSFPLYNGEPASKEARELDEASRGVSGKAYAQRLAAADAGQLAALAKELQKKAVAGSEDFVCRANAAAAAVQQPAAAQQEESAARPAPSFRMAAAGALAALAAITALMVFNHTMTRKAVRDELVKKDYEFSEELARERAFFARDLEEKYRADQVSLQAMARRLEIEKQKSLEAQKKAERPTP